MIRRNEERCYRNRASGGAQVYQQVGPLVVFEEMFRRQASERDKGCLRAVLYCAFVSIRVSVRRLPFRCVGLELLGRGGGLSIFEGRAQLYQQLGRRVLLEMNFLGVGEAWR